MKRISFAIILLGTIAALALPSPAQVSGTWSTTGSMSTGRYAITAVVLKDGKVLVAGGISGSTVVNTAEVYDPATGAWTSTGNMKMGRAYYVAVLLPNGKVLVAGGCTNSNCSAATRTAELYNPTTGEWTATRSMSTLRYFFAGTRLNDGQVLVEGGCSRVNCGANSATAELYDPRARTWTLTGSMSSARDYHTATRLADGRVMVTGGYTGGNLSEIYDPSTGAWTTTSPALYSHALHSSTLLPGGKVLVEGGIVGYLPSALCELYDPETAQWSSTGSMITKRDNQAALMLPNGKAMVAGGGSYTRPKYYKLASAELYDPKTGTWSQTGSMGTERYEQGMVLLGTGQVLVVGGLSNLNVSLSSAELYAP